MTETSTREERPNAEDESVLAALRAGDESVFMMLVERYQSQLVRVALMYVSTRESAEEVVQETWLGVLNDTRLVLGTRLGVTEEERVLDPADPDAGAYALYQWLTWVQGDLVEELL